MSRIRVQLLAAVFKLEGGKHPVYWIYGYKRGRSRSPRAQGEVDPQKRGQRGRSSKAKLEKERRGAATQPLARRSTPFRPEFPWGLYRFVAASTLWW